MKNLENFYGGDDELSSMTGAGTSEDKLEKEKTIPSIHDSKSDNTEHERSYISSKSEEFSSRDYYKEVLKNNK